MAYNIRLKAREDFTKDADFLNNGHTDENGRGVWFDSLEDAKEECKRIGAYSIIDDEFCEPVWYNPDYKSESFERMKKFLSEKLMPRL